MKLVAENISVNRGIRRIVENISFSLAQGEALLVTGTNGAGKSTLLRALCGLLPLAGGRLTLSGLEEEGDPFAIREHMHFLGPQNAMKASLTVGENLRFWQDFCSPPGDNGRMPVEEALALVELEHAIDLPFSYLSTGMKRRAAIARLLVADKPVWVVDEPTSGLDRRSTELFSRLCRDYCSDGGMLIAATHLPLGLDNAYELEIPALAAGAETTDPFADMATGTETSA